MTQVNPHASTHVSGLSANPTRPGSRRSVFWLVTVCLFFSVAVLIYLETIHGDRIYSPRWLNYVQLCLIVPPLWYIPILVSDIRAVAQRVDPHRSSAYSFIVNMTKVTGIMFLIIFIATCSVFCLAEVFLASHSASLTGMPVLEGVHQTMQESEVPNEQPVLPAHSLGDQ